MSTTPGPVTVEDVQELTLLIEATLDRQRRATKQAATYRRRAAALMAIRAQLQGTVQL